MIYINFFSPVIISFDIKSPVYMLIKSVCIYIVLQKGEKESLSKAQINIKVSLNKDVPFSLSSDIDLEGFIC